MGLDKWLPFEDVKLQDGILTSDNLNIEYVMYTTFDENCEGGICTASVKFKMKDGTETEWYHPSMENFDND